MAKTTLKAVHRIMLDGGSRSSTAKYAEPGTLFQISSEEAERLVRLGAATKSAEKFSEAETQPDQNPDRETTDELTVEQRDAHILAAVRELMGDSDEAPNVGPVNEKMPESNLTRVTAKERDAAVEKVKAERASGATTEPGTQSPSGEGSGEGSDLI